MCGLREWGQDRRHSSERQQAEFESGKGHEHNQQTFTTHNLEMLRREHRQQHQGYGTFLDLLPPHFVWVLAWAFP